MHAPLDDAGISLRTTLPHGRAISSEPSSDIQIQSLCSDSRRVRPGDLFVALMGPHGDGHDHIAEAIARGASAVLSEKMLPTTVPQFIVSDTRVAYSHLCLELAGRPERDLRLTAVAGTAGKTVTSLLMASVFRAAGRRVGLTSSIGYCDSEDLAPARETTPRAPEFATWLRRMAENQCDDAVIEVDGAAIADRRVDGVELDAAILTNLYSPSPECQSRFGNFAAYQRLAARVTDRLRSDSVAIVNADDPMSMDWAQRLNCAYLTVSMKNQGDVTATILERNRGDQTFMLNVGVESAMVRTRMLGDFHVQNCLSAAALGLALGISLGDIIRGLESLDRVPGRLDRVVAGQGAGVFLDESMHCSTLANNLRAVRDVTPGKVFCVYGAHAADDDAICASRGRVVERHADRSIVTGGGADTKASLQSLHCVVDGYRRPGAAHLIPDRLSAIEWALNEAQSSDTVLIAGAAAGERLFVEQILRTEEGFNRCVEPSDDSDGPAIYRIDDYR